MESMTLTPDVGIVDNVYNNASRLDDEQEDNKDRGKGASDLAGALGRTKNKRKPALENPKRQRSKSKG